ncbi:MAG: arsenate reductase ArsC [Betaproteobacteria bacterium]|jgi:protein-tyrosine-phosphatase|nr:arsenate reductase ArsC [Betaproteobacteria bacterium]
MPDRPFHVLFLCTGNSARSILAEGLLTRLGGARFRAFSAGSRPAGAVQPLAAEWLAARGVDPSPLRSKSWDELAGAGAPPIDLVVTVCDAAASEACPVWPGAPLTAHWGLPDPAAAVGDDATRRRAFAYVGEALERRLAALVRLPVESADRAELELAVRRLADG